MSPGARMMPASPALTRIRCEVCGRQAQAYDLDGDGAVITHPLPSSDRWPNRTCPLPRRFCEAPCCPFGCGAHQMAYGRYPIWIHRLIGIRVKTGDAHCDDQCRHARSAICACACRGVNHGIAF